MDRKLAAASEDNRSNTAFEASPLDWASFKGDLKTMLNCQVLSEDCTAFAVLL